MDEGVPEAESGGVLDQRRRRLRAELSARGAAGYWAAPGPNLAYLGGVTADGHERILGLFVGPEGDPVWVAPWNAAAQLADLTRLPVEAWADRDGPRAALRRVLAGRAPLVIDGHLPLRHFHEMSQALAGAGAAIVPDDGVVEGLRAIKGADELARLREAAEVTARALGRVVAGGMGGDHEDAIARALVIAGVELGADVSFPPIVAAGAAAAEPHHIPARRRLGAGEAVLVDYGLRAGGYCGDTTRMVYPADVSAEIAECREAVREAYQAALASVGPGVPAEEVDAARRRVLTRAGYGPHMGGRAGHGLGLEVHEAPFIVLGNREPLRPGHVFTIEPGVYMPGRFGIRFENTVVVTEDGKRVLSGPPEVLTR